MQKNWYVLYTKPQSEKKVATLLTKKKYENFIPQIYNEAQKSWRNKVVAKPLFKSYVFVNATQQDVASIAQVDGVINLLYWLGSPVIIPQAEINEIREFTSDYKNVVLEKISFDAQVSESGIYHTSYEIEGNLLAIKNKTIKINLLTLGYSMIAHLNDDSIFGRQRASQNYTFAQS